MKRQISISIFFALFLILLVWLYIKFYNENKLPDPKTATEMEETEESIEISQEYVSFLFYIKEEQGKVVVYTTENQEFYMETGISTYTLPEGIQQKLVSGIFFESESELYDFLESYSS